MTDPALEQQIAAWNAAMKEGDSHYLLHKNDKYVQKIMGIFGFADEIIRALIRERDGLLEENKILREAVYPCPEVKRTAPLILYFENKEEREEFVEIYRQAKPNAKAHSV